MNSSITDMLTGFNVNLSPTLTFSLGITYNFDTTTSGSRAGSGTGIRVVAGDRCAGTRPVAKALETLAVAQPVDPQPRGMRLLGAMAALSAQ